MSSKDITEANSEQEGDENEVRAIIHRKSSNGFSTMEKFRLMNGHYLLFFAL